MSIAKSESWVVIKDTALPIRFLPSGSGSAERVNEKRNGTWKGEYIQLDVDQILTLDEARQLSDHLRDLTLSTGNVYPSIALYSGAMYDFLYVEDNTVCIEDVAHALSMNCRFGGHCSEFYSVAEHSVRASYVEETVDPFAKLMHDSPEAVLLDFPTPIKRLLRDYTLLTERVETNFSKIFGYEYPLSESVHHADLVMLATEKRDLKPNSGHWAMLNGVPTLPGIVEPWSPKEACRRFLERYEELRP